MEGPQIEVDWTVNPGTGRTNSSPEFEILVREVSEIIKGDAVTLMSGNSEKTARLIIAQLAHKHGVAPRLVDIKSFEATKGVLSGMFVWNDTAYTYEATPMKP